MTGVCRRELVLSQREQTALAECTMSKLAKPRKSPNTTHPFASLNTWIHLAVELLLQEAGIKQSRWRFSRPSVPIHAQSIAQYWDIRSQNPVSSVTLPERCYTLDVSYPLMVVGTAERHIQIFNLTSPTAVYKVIRGSPEFLKVIY